MFNLKIKMKVIKLLQLIIGNKLIIKLIEKATATLVLKKIPLGFDPIINIKHQFPNYKTSIIFDVGANIGQSENMYSNQFKDASIYCFEPVKETYNILIKNIKGRNTNCFNCALGELNGVAEMQIDKNNLISESNALVNDLKIDNTKYIYEKIDIITIDTFLQKNTITNINFLKIDTEGNDLNVLKGAKETLATEKIDFIQVEVGMNALNKLHVSFIDVVDFLKTYNYNIYGIYDQIHEFQLNRPILRRCNIVFISNKISQNKN